MPSRHDIQRVLTPTPSVSRAGKMASTSFTNFPARLHSPTKLSKEHAILNSINVAEVVQPEALEAFGSGPTVDGGNRGQELCSSARQHPQLQQKMQYVVAAEKEHGFLTAMRQLESPTKGNDDRGLSAEEHRLWMEEKLRHIGPPPELNHVDVKPSASFQSPTRWRDAPSRQSSNAPPPPVGHYRPKFSAVEPKSHAAKMSKTERKTMFELASSPTPKLKKRKTLSRLSTAEAALGASSSINVSQTLMQTTQSFRVASPTSPSSPQRSPRRNSPDNASIVPTPARRAQTPSSMFMSKTPIAANAKRPKPYRDVAYNPVFRPHNDESRGLLAMDKRSGRTNSSLALNMLDLFYEPKKLDASGADVAFSKQISRDRRRHVLTPDHLRNDKRPLSCDAEIERLKFKRTPTPIQMDKQTARRPLGLAAGATSPDPSYNVSAPMAQADTSSPWKTVAAHKQGVVSIATQLGRAEVVPPPQFNAEYDPHFDAVERRSPTTCFTPEKRTRSPKATPTGPEMYNADVSPVRPRITRQIVFDTERHSEIAQRSKQAVNSVARDAEYRTDSVQLKPRVVGNPMMATHMSRDRRVDLTSPKKAGTGTLPIEPRLEAVMVPITRKNIDFSRDVSREKHRGNYFAHTRESTPGPGEYDK